MDNQPTIDELRVLVSAWPEARKRQLARLLEMWEKRGPVIGLMDDSKTPGGLQVIRCPLDHEAAIRRAYRDLAPIVESVAAGKLKPPGFPPGYGTVNWTRKR